MLKPFISNELRASTNPIFYLSKDGKKSVGYDALLLPDVVNVYLDYRNACLGEGKGIPPRYSHIIAACDALSRGLQKLEIIGLVDEATGFQEARDRRALQELLDQFLRKELAAWAKRFPDEFYEHIFRLRNWKWKGRGTNPPQAVAGYTKDIVYARLTGSNRGTRKKESTGGQRKAKHHEWLTDDVGHPALAQHLHAVITLMRISTSWDQFKMFLDQAHARRGDTMQLPLMTDFPTHGRPPSLCRFFRNLPTRRCIEAFSARLSSLQSALAPKSDSGRVFALFLWRRLTLAHFARGDIDHAFRPLVQVARAFGGLGHPLLCRRRTKPDMALSASLLASRCVALMIGVI